MKNICSFLFYSILSVKQICFNPSGGSFLTVGVTLSTFLWLLCCIRKVHLFYSLSHNVGMQLVKWATGGINPERALYVISDCMFEMIFPQLITPGYKDSCHVGVLSLTVSGWRLIFMGTDNTGGDVMNAFSVRKLSHHPEMKCSIIEKASLLKYPLVSIYLFLSVRGQGCCWLVG